MKTKINYLLILLVAIPLAFFNCSDKDNNDPEPEVVALKLDKASIALEPGTSGEVKIEAGSSEYEVASDKVEVATAVLSGKTITITAVAAGEAKVKVTDKKDNSKSQTVTVTVANEIIGVTSIKVSNKEGEDAEFTLAVGQVLTAEELGLVVAILPEGATNTAYSIAGDEFVEVVKGEEGTYSFKGLKAGEATLTVSSDDNEDVSATFKVVVKGFGILSTEGWSVDGNSESKTVNYGGGFNALIDGNYNTFWHSNELVNYLEEMPYILKVTMAEKQMVSSAEVFRRIHNGAVWPAVREIAVSFSADDITYTEPIVHNFGDITHTSLEDDLSYDFKLDNPMMTQYVKVEITETNTEKGTASGGQASLAEIEVYGFQ